MSAYRPLFVDAEEAIRREAPLGRLDETKRRLDAIMDALPVMGPVTETLYWSRVEAYLDLVRAGLVSLHTGVTFGFSDLLRDL